MSNELPNPPLIVTDLPTSIEYLNGQTNFAGYNSNYQATPVDPTRRYANSGGHIVALDTTPDGFSYPEHARGVIAVYGTTSNAFTGTILRVAVHKPTHNIGDYSTGWTLVEGASLSYTGEGPNNAYLGWAGIASQRKGDYSYVLMHFFSSPLFADATDQVSVYKVTRGEYVEAGPKSGTGTLNGFSQGSSILNGRGSWFVSDDEQPFLWNVANQISFNTIGGGSPNSGPIAVTGFRDDGGISCGWRYDNFNHDPVGGHYARTLTGQAGAYYQLYDLPKGKYGVGPFLVFPWRDGDYSPPELWFVLLDMVNGKTTGTFSVYKSTWTRGAYRSPQSQATGSDQWTFPDAKLNKDGYAFDHDWYKPENFVTTLGPFPGLNIFNPAATSVAVAQNNSFPTTAGIVNPGQIGFSFERDKSKQDIMHAFAQVSATPYTTLPSYYPNGYNSVYYLNSGDDGKTFSRPHILIPSVVADPNGTTPSNTALTSTAVQRNGRLRTAHVDIAMQTLPNLSVVRTNQDMMLLGGVAVNYSYKNADGTALPFRSQPADGGQHAALIAIDYTGRGFGTDAPHVPIFRSGVTRGQTAWQ